MSINFKAKIKYYLIPLFGILIISFLVLYPSFNLAFQDEEWQGVVLPRTVYANYITEKLTSYSSPMWFMTNLYSSIGPNFSTYFFISFIFKTILAISVFVLLCILTKSRLASFLGGVLIAVGFSGIQNSIETINMISYISFTLILIFLSTFFLLQGKFSYKSLTIMGISLFASTFLTSFRTYPLYAWIFLVSGSKAISDFNKRIFKPNIWILVITLFNFLFLYKIGIFSWYTRDDSTTQGASDISRFIQDLISLVINLNQTIISNYLKGLGNLVLPDILDKSGTLSLMVGASFILLLIYLVFNSIKNKTITNLLYFIFWTHLFYSSYFLIYINSLNNKDAAIFNSVIRYQLLPFVGLGIAMGIFVSKILQMNIKKRKILISFTIIFIFMHALTTHFYLSNLSKQRDGLHMQKIWTQMKQVVPEASLSKEKVNIFYFETDGSSRATYTVNDGFIGHMIALYKIDEKPVSEINPEQLSAFGKLIAPPLLSFPELITVVKDNNNSKVWNNIFALRVEGDKLIDIKEQVKKRVEIELNEPQN